jgi:hypothetical protein
MCLNWFASRCCPTVSVLSIEACVVNCWAPVMGLMLRHHFDAGSEAKSASNVFVIVVRSYFTSTLTIRYGLAGALKPGVERNGSH